MSLAQSQYAAVKKQARIPYQRLSCRRIDSRRCILCPWNCGRSSGSGCTHRSRWVLPTPSCCTLTGYRRTSESPCAVQSRIQYRRACAHVTISQSVHGIIVTHRLLEKGSFASTKTLQFPEKNVVKSYSSHRLLEKGISPPPKHRSFVVCFYFFYTVYCCNVSTALCHITVFMDTCQCKNSCLGAPALHCESKKQDTKTRHQTLAHNFTKYWPIYKILYC